MGNWGKKLLWLHHKSKEGFMIEFYINFNKITVEKKLTLKIIYVTFSWFSIRHSMTCRAQVGIGVPGPKIRFTPALYNSS